MFVATKASRLKRVPETIETVVYEEPKKKKKTNESEEEPKNPEKSSQESVNKTSKEKQKKLLMKLKYEVIKFGSTGFENITKQQARAAHAIALGAKPPKKEYKNYKEILAAKQKEKIEKGMESESEMLKTKTDNLFAPNSLNLKFHRKKREIKGLLNSYGESKRQTKRKGKRK